MSRLSDVITLDLVEPDFLAGMLSLLRSFDFLTIQLTVALSRPAQAAIARKLNSALLHATIFASSERFKCSNFWPGP